MANETPQSGKEEAQSATPAAKPQYTPDELKAGQKNGDSSRADVNLDLVLDIPVEVSLRVGSTDISIRDLVSLVEGSVISLDEAAGAPMNVLVNGTLIATGEIVIVDDQYGVRLIDVVSPVERVQQLN
ncbi:MAG: flagellar motor switch protein FliN [Gammaproteobacteria bacterium]|nr:flagellar motor switch protein FliN [Gammaproteobacteria bacterium]